MKFRAIAQQAGTDHPAVQADSLYDLGLAIGDHADKATVWLRDVRTGLTLEDVRKARPQMLCVEESQSFLINIRPKPAQKTSAAGKFSQSQAKYHAYKDEIRSACNAQGFAPCDIAELHCLFLMPLPLSCFDVRGNIKQSGLDLIGQSHEPTPDTDNLLKPVADALSRQDSAIAVMHGEKFYGSSRMGAIVVTLKIRKVVSQQSAPPVARKARHGAKRWLHVVS
jgi:Holliday junction resolvase RusA-like endonuclease